MLRITQLHKNRNFQNLKEKLVGISHGAKATKPPSNSEVSGETSQQPPQKDSGKMIDQRSSTFRASWSSGKIQSIQLIKRTAEWLPCSWYLRQVSTCSVLLQIVSPLHLEYRERRLSASVAKSRHVLCCCPSGSQTHPPWDSLSCCLTLPFISTSNSSLGTDS